MNLKDSDVTKDFVKRVLTLIRDGIAKTPYSVYNNLSCDFKEIYSLYDIVVLFHKLEWNCRVIEIDEIREANVWDPWKGDYMKRKIINFRLRFQFHLFEHDDELFSRIVRNLDTEDVPRFKP